MKAMSLSLLFDSMLWLFPYTLLLIDYLTCTKYIHFFDHHFKNTDVEKIFGSQGKDKVKLLIIFSVKEVIYFKRTPCKRVTISDFKMYFLKNLNITKSHKRTINDGKFFDQKWKVFIHIIRLDHIT